MRRSFAGAGAVALALALSTVTAQDSGWWSQAGFALNVPRGWQITRDVPDHGLTLRPAEAGAPSVSIVTWHMSVGVSGPEGAAEEHERLLAAAMRYRRLGVEAIRAPGVGEGVLVQGVAQGADGGEQGSLFAAFVAGTRAYVVGTFTKAGAFDRARNDYLEPVLSGFALTGGAPAVGPSRPLSPGRATEASPTPPPRTEGGSTRESGTPATSTPRGATYADPTGFSLAPPLGWRCAVEGNCVRVSSREGASLLLAPVRCPEGAPGWVEAADLIAECLGGLDGVRLVSCDRQPAAGGALWLRVKAEADGQALEGRFSLAATDGAGLLTGVLAPAGRMDATGGAAREVLASFQADLPDPRTPAAATGGTERRDLGGPLVLAQPDGWTLLGGPAAYDRKPVIAIEGRATDGTNGWFVWQQPVRPMFRELTDAMRRLGFRDGDPYYAYDGIDPRMVLPRGPAADLVTRRLLPEALRGTGDGPATREDPVSGLALLGRGGEQTSLVETAGGWFVVSQAPIGEEREGRFWEAACLGFGGTPGHRAEAARALERVVRSATVPASADAATRAGLEALIAVTRAALDSTTWRELIGGPALPALPTGKGAGAERRHYAVSAPVIEAWSLTSAGPGP